MKYSQRPRKANPPVEVLRTLYRYDPETGDIFNQKTGRLFTMKSRRYRVLWIDKQLYFAHRIIWTLMTGENAPHEIDHIDRNPLNNRWDNLRAVDHFQNNHNRAANREAAVKSKGVTLHPNGKFRVQIMRYGEKRHIGMYLTEEEAAAAYEAAAAGFRS